MKKLYNRGLVTLGLIGSGVGISMAQEAEVGSGFDTAVADAVGVLTDTVQPALMLVGGAIVSLAVVVFGFRWIKATFF